MNLPSTAAPTDIEALARAGARLGSPPAQTTAASPLRIFITLEMPREPATADRSKPRSGAVLVLQGPEGQLDARETLAAVSSLIGERQVAWVIDPKPSRHRIERAPTFVLSLDDRADTATSCGTDCRTPPAFVSVSGDVSLDHALDTLARQRRATAGRAASRG